MKITFLNFQNNADAKKLFKTYYEIEHFQYFLSR